MKHIKAIIGITIVIIIITIIIIMVLLNRTTIQNTIQIKEPTTKIETYEKIQDYSSFYTVVNCINKYLMYENIDINEKLTIDNEGYVNSSTAESLGITTEEEKKKVLYDILDNEYLEDNKINITLGNSTVKFLPNKMKFKEQGNIQIYGVYGTIVDSKTNTIKFNRYFIVKIDKNNDSFQIVPIPEDMYQKLEDIELTTTTNEIKKNNNNTYTKAKLEQVDIVQKLFADYKENMLINPQKTYSMLNKEYRELKFIDYEDYKKYLEENITTLLKATATKYQTTTTDDYTQYIIIDQEGNYYIFRETAVMEYSVILDTYTIDLPEFIEKYNNSNEQQKVALNINKFMNAINKKDYKYAYSKLADSFKQNYFKTQESFENYVKNNFFESNKITFKDFGNQATIYTYTTILTNKNTNQTKQQNFVVKLGEGTEFEMSFEVI